jgi:hypothetical protein
MSQADVVMHAVLEKPVLHRRMRAPRTRMIIATSILAAGLVAGGSRSKTTTAAAPCRSGSTVAC